MTPPGTSLGSRVRITISENDELNAWLVSDRITDFNCVGDLVKTSSI